MDGMLSQDEINALLSGMSTGSDFETQDETASESVSDVDGTATEDFVLTESEKDAVGEISNISMGTAATTLSSLLNQKVNITTPKVEIATWDDLSRKYDRPCVMMQISYKEGLDGNNVLILKEKDVKVITDLMMGGPGVANDDEELSELHLSAIGEAMNQMMGSAATSLSSMFNRKIDISPPNANLIETYNELDESLPKFLMHAFVMVAFKMQIGDLIDSEIMQLYPIEFAQELLNMFAPGNAEATPQAAPSPAPQAAPS
ncbi:MAG: flagellar motor switch phosphatase FliY, partial [Eubacteriales bacterium]|nr:flagellar motor switch phosphatase FliY [Eubacteriales bacterium]